MTNGMLLPVGLKSPAAFTVLVFVASASDSKSEEGSSTLPDRASRTAQDKVFSPMPEDFILSPRYPQRRIWFGKGSVRWPDFSLGLRIKAVHEPLKLWEMERYHQPQPGWPDLFGAWNFQNPSWRNWQSRKAQTFHVVGSNPSDGTTPSSPIGSRQGT